MQTSEVIKQSVGAILEQALIIHEQALYILCASMLAKLHRPMLAY